MKSRLSNQAIILAVVAIWSGATTEIRAGRIGFDEIDTKSLCGGTATPESLTGNLRKEFKGICSTDIIFEVRDTGDRDPRMEVLMETVMNSSGQTWTDFHIQLGFGFGPDFKPIPQGCVSFKEPEKATLTPFKVQGGNSMVINGGGATLTNGNRGSFTFTLNVPDSAKCPGAPPDPRGYKFTLRETPTTSPEPATMVLLGTGLAGVAIKTRKRFKTRKRAQRSQ